MFIVMYSGYNTEPWTTRPTYSEALALCEMLAYEEGWLFWVNGDDPFYEGQYARMFANMELWKKQNPIQHAEREAEFKRIREYGRMY